MWCDRQPGSQPPISANGHDLFAGLGLWGAGRRRDIDRIICMSAKSQAREWLKGSYKGIDGM